MHRDARSRLATFKAFANTCQILPLTPQSIIYSAELYADLRRQGTPVDDTDLLIAGVALEYNLTLVTNNLRHFGKIQRLTLYPLPLHGGNSSGKAKNIVKNNHNYCLKIIIVSE